MKLPPFGKDLAILQSHHNPPMYAVVTLGQNEWQRAKDWNASRADTCAMVLPAGHDPDAYTWPVDRLPVVIESDFGPSQEQVKQLALRLLVCGATRGFQINQTRPVESWERYTRYQWKAE